MLFLLCRDYRIQGSTRLGLLIMPQQRNRNCETCSHGICFAMTGVREQHYFDFSVEIGGCDSASRPTSGRPMTTLTCHETWAGMIILFFAHVGKRFLESFEQCAAVDYDVPASITNFTLYDYQAACDVYNKVGNGRSTSSMPNNLSFRLYNKDFSHK